MTRAGLKPARIRISMLTHFRPSELPPLQKVQNVVDRAFNGGEDDHEAFSFGWDVERDGAFVVGNGSDGKPFLVGFTTKALLRQADRDPSTFIFHVDATYKANQVGYPLIVIGITDVARRFHLLCIFVTSQQQQEHFAKVFAALRWIYRKVVGTPLRVHFVMGDADMAQYNALASVFSDYKYIHLMCYYHVIAKVVDRLKGFSNELSSTVLQDVYDMHYSRSSEELTTIRTAVEFRWQSNPLLQSFHAYFKRVWMNERFFRWQCFRTPPGFATTNNPVEQFNH
eukprot:jgi/Phyca11/108898/e_gw1.16.660.1